MKTPNDSTNAPVGSPQLKESATTNDRHRQEPIAAAPRTWLKIVAGPLLFVAAGALLIVGLGVAQRGGWITAGGSTGTSVAASEGGADTRTYICPMLCTPPQIGPGRCPVCEMELVPAASGGGDDAGANAVQIDPASRRVAHIETVAVESRPVMRQVRAVGELHYDEGAMKTIAAYVDGRLDRLYADFTGVVVGQGDHLALLYSPRLYSAQVEYLLALASREKSRDATLSRVQSSTRDMLQSSRQRLVELGMTDEQITSLEQTREANSRLHLCAPISGTVIKKLATEGQYVKEGQPIYELADLRSVWLMVKLFPEDAAAIRYGQQVEAEVQSLPGRNFTGRVAFVDPVVDMKTRTVGVRVVMPNEDGLLRVGDFARATIETPAAAGSQVSRIYDPELAGKWISPRHPHVVEAAPGKCRICGVDLLPASQLGFTDDPTAAGESLVVPRGAVLMAGEAAVVYVESEPGVFEMRQVDLGPRCGDQLVILDGLSVGEKVAVSGNFLIDSQMQLAGKPSLIDPTKHEPSLQRQLDEEDIPSFGEGMMIAADGEASASPMMQMAEIADDADDGQLSADDAVLASRQAVCPVSDMKLGSMGPPVKIVIDGRPVFICCEGCRKRLLAEPARYLAKLDDQSASQEESR